MHGARVKIMEKGLVNGKDVLIRYLYRQRGLRVA
jgi:hypothetical protein